MEDSLKSRFKLLPVRFAPFFAAGIILCADGGIMAIVTAMAAVILALLAFKLRKSAFASALGLAVGAVVVILYIFFVCQPLINQIGSTHSLTATVTAKYDYGGYAAYCADTVVDSRFTSISFYYEDTLYEGDVVSGDFYLKSRYENGSIIQRAKLSATVEELTDIHRSEFSLRRSIADFRRELSDKVDEMGDAETIGLAKGLLFGDTSGFSAKLNHASKVSGVMHFTAVSGSHFVIIMSVVLAFVTSRGKARAIVSLIFIPLCVLFFGTEPTVIRAGIMLLIGNCGSLFNRKGDTLNSLCVSVVAMTLFTPDVMLELGFQMSVMGVFGVSVVAPCFSKLISGTLLPDPIVWAINLIAMPACAVICIAPLSVGAFGGISLVGVFATLVLTPFFTAALAFGVVFALTGIETLIAPIGLTIRPCYDIILFFGSNNRMWLTLDFPFADILTLIAALSLIFIIAAPHSARKLAALFTVTSVLSVSLSVITSEAQRKITFLSNGESGAAVVCIKRSAVILISGNGERLEESLADCLLSGGIHEVELISAPDLTTAGEKSVINLSELYPIKSVAAYGFDEELPDETELLNFDIPMISADGITISAARAGDTEVSADIVLYSGYKMSVPETGEVRLPIYVSSRQNILPENGINISDNQLVINLHDIKN